MVGLVGLVGWLVAVVVVWLGPVAPKTSTSIWESCSCQLCV